MRGRAGLPVLITASYPRGISAIPACTYLTPTNGTTPCGLTLPTPYAAFHNVLFPPVRTYLCRATVPTATFTAARAPAGFWLDGCDGLFAMFYLVLWSSACRLLYSACRHILQNLTLARAVRFGTAGYQPCLPAIHRAVCFWFPDFVYSDIMYPLLYPIMRDHRTHTGGVVPAHRLVACVTTATPPADHDNRYSRWLT